MIRAKTIYLPIQIKRNSQTLYSKIIIETQLQKNNRIIKWFKIHQNSQSTLNKICKFRIMSRIKFSNRWEAQHLVKKIKV
jgi:hypothetical protein